MKNLLFILALVPAAAFTQVHENFESGTMGSWVESVSGRWAVSGDMPLAGNFSLRHIFDNPDSGTDQIGIDIAGLNLAAATTVWQFRLRHGYDPSSSNNWAVFLTSDGNPGNMKPGAAVNGFALAVNFTGYDDTLRLLRIDNGLSTPIVNSGVNWQNSIGADSAALLRVERSPAGEWSLKLLDNGGKTIVARTGTDNILPQVGWFGLFYRYSSTRDRLLWFDDLEIEGVWEEIDPPVKPRQGDIIISEIMVNPLPVVGLPGFEYLEMYNPTVKLLSLSGCSLMVNTTRMALPAMNVEPGGRVILCSVAATELFSAFGSVAGLKSFPSLPDKGAMVALTDSAGLLIHGVEYSDTWYGEPLKSKGGWSLEMIDEDYPFYGAGNWKASSARAGGTPGTPGSVAAVNPDTRLPEITNIFPTDSISLQITLNKGSVNLLTVLLADGRIGGMNIAGASYTSVLQQSLLVTLSESLKRGVVYSLSLPPEVLCLSGNPPSSRVFSFALPETAQSGDLRFNEILFDPWPDEYDWVEFVNVSTRTLDASRLLIVSRNPSTGSQSDALPLSAGPRCILPGAYFAVTAEPGLLPVRFPQAVAENIFPVAVLPSLPDDKALVFLYNRELELIDRISYDKSMHFALLSGVEGVSLEKVHPEADSWDRQNWHSAAGASGWGTPGGVNSVYTETIPGGAGVTLSGQRITPDSDGIDDLLTVSFTSPSVQNVLRIIVFSENGYPVRTIADNLTTGHEAIFTWDGTDDNGALLPTGIYIVWVSAFNPAGNVTKWKRAVALLRR